MTLHNPTAFTTGSGLVVLEDSSWDERAIQRELTKRDRDLFLDKEADQRFGRIVYVVRLRMPEPLPPHDVFYWVGDRGEPLPLSSGLLNKLDSMEKGTRNSESAVDRVHRVRREATERNRAETDAAYEEIFRDGARRLDPMHSAVLHRGQHLRRSRDAERARGRKV